MKAPVILLLSTDPLVERATLDAVLHTRHGLRTIHSASEAFHLLRDGCEDFDLAIIDLDPGMHGAALLEAAGDRLPVLVLTSLEENYMHPVATRHGARGCLAKPCTAEKLVAAIEAVLQMSHAAVA